MQKNKVNICLIHIVIFYRKSMDEVFKFLMCKIRSFYRVGLKKK